ncbi:microtubule-associated protein CRIPT-domain-containing protein [Pelagophyceae sp. CCMP2097]|nr:microtubule-associated protein CRIPT-domain-containing protein [Pelagophyceae sp. CCMP2097]|mmetsp:Transcript_3374/g.10206  ORF Transcript_3374/g.10206 Transcript_3374/m.10206 type:complete len:289 (-) Transcript_3374:269-1135(-)
MVCQDCEKKLTKVIVPDKWKDGARNVSDDGGRATTYKNSLLQVRGSTQRYTAGVNSCKICKSKVAQEAHYCQECAHQNGICAMCGKRVEDLRFDNRGKVQNLKFKKSLEARKEDAEKPDRDKGDEGGYGTAERFAKKQKMDDDAENAELPPIEELSEEAQKAIDDAAAAAVAQEAYSSALEMASTRVAQNHGRSLEGVSDGSAEQANAYAGWASAFDAGSGRTYYFHAQTRVTSWVWPPHVEAAAQSVDPDFKPSQKFDGAKAGFVFAMREKGLGYHRDVAPTVAPAA